MEIVPRSTAGIDAYQRRLTTLTGSALQGLGRDFTVLKGFDPVQGAVAGDPEEVGQPLGEGSSPGSASSVTKHGPAEHCARLQRVYDPIQPLRCWS